MAERTRTRQQRVPIRGQPSTCARSRNITAVANRAFRILRTHSRQLQPGAFCSHIPPIRSFPTRTTSRWCSTTTQVIVLHRCRTPRRWPSNATASASPTRSSIDERDSSTVQLVGSRKSAARSYSTKHGEGRGWCIAATGPHFPYRHQRYGREFAWSYWRRPHRQYPLQGRTHYRIRRQQYGGTRAAICPIRLSRQYG